VALENFLNQRIKVNGLLFYEEGNRYAKIVPEKLISILVVNVKYFSISDNFLPENNT
jgi:hypothetical protein